MTLNNSIAKIKSHIQNIPGWRTNRKIVVIESDDWGSIRMPSKSVYQNLLKHDIRVDQSIFDTFDCLEKKKDLELLFELLLKYKLNGYDSSPVFTFNTVLGNPDFDKIEDDDFETFHHEHFYKSYEKYNGENLESLWNEGIDNHIIKPQLHAREHLNTSLWMNALKNNYKETLVAFYYRFFGLKTKTPSKKHNHYLSAYHPTGEQDYFDKVEILTDAIDLFEKTFNYMSRSFIACNYVWPSALEEELSLRNVDFLQTQRGHVDPTNTGRHKKIRLHFIGQKNGTDQIYTVRNCFFEPALDPAKDWVNTCLNEIKIAFKWHKPAIISSHRINYVSGLSKLNRDRGLKALERLLRSINKNWPEVEYLTSDKLGELILKSI